MPMINVEKYTLKACTLHIYAHGNVHSQELINLFEVLTLINNSLLLQFWMIFMHALWHSSCTKGLEADVN